MRKLVKISLIILNIICWSGAIASTIAHFQNGNDNALAVLLLIVVINAVCARYLYTKAETNRIEWALFGLVGNWVAIVAYKVSRK